MRNLGKIVGATLAASALYGIIFGLRGAADVSPRIVPTKRHAVYQWHIDQVFRDFRGYRIISTDDRGLVSEFIFKGPEWRPGIFPKIPGLDLSIDVTKSPGQVQIFKDLKPEEHAYCTLVKYEPVGYRHVREYVEVHLPKSLGISPGIDTTGGKFPTYAPMREIK